MRSDGSANLRLPEAPTQLLLGPPHGSQEGRPAVLPLPGGLPVSLARFELADRVTLLEARVKKLEDHIRARLKEEAETRERYYGTGLPETRRLDTRGRPEGAWRG